jgi:hypothetical protein
MFPGTILLKDYHQETHKMFASIGFQPVDTLVNIAFDQVLKLYLNRKHSPARSVNQTKVNTLDNPY